MTTSPELSPKPLRESLSRIESEKEQLIQENIQLRQQTEALGNAAQVIGNALQARVKVVESRHEAEKLRETINSGKTREETRREKRKRKDEAFYRDIAMFLAGAVAATVVFGVMNATLRKH
jgi:hypothetical protein